MIGYVVLILAIVWAAFVALANGMSSAPGVRISQWPAAIGVMIGLLLIIFG